MLSDISSITAYLLYTVHMSLMQKQLGGKRIYWSHICGLDHLTLGAICGIWGLTPKPILSLPMLLRLFLSYLVVFNLEIGLW